MKLTDTFLSCHLPCMFCAETSGAIFLTLEGTRRIFFRPEEYGIRSRTNSVGTVEDWNSKILE